MHIVYVLAPGGGPEAFVKTLSPWLQKRGHRVSVIYVIRRARHQNQLGDSVRVSYAPPTSAHYYLGKMTGDFRAWPLRVRALEAAWATYRAALAIDSVDPIDVIEVTEGMHVFLLLRRWAVAVRAHGSDWTFRIFCQDSDLKHDDLLISSEAVQLKKAQGVTAISRTLACHLADTCGISADRINVIPYPVDAQLFCPNGTQFSPRNKTTLMTVGRLEQRKGVDVLLKAMTFVWGKIPDVHLRVVGAEAQFTRNDLLAMVPEEERWKVTIIGSLPHDALPALYRQTTLYVTATQYETLGYTILEAMASGIPVVATSVGAVPELVEDGVTGMLVPRGDERRLAAAIERLLLNEKERVAMGRRARERAVANYAVEDIGQRNEAFYARAVARG
jgi:glycosyltransferase involved in cell wall biosynthesis